MSANQGAARETTAGTHGSAVKSAARDQIEIDMTHVVSASQSAAMVREAASLIQAVVRGDKYVRFHQAHRRNRA